MLIIYLLSALQLILYLEYRRNESGLKFKEFYNASTKDILKGLFIMLIPLINTIFAIFITISIVDNFVKKNKL